MGGFEKIGKDGTGTNLDLHLSQASHDPKYESQISSWDIKKDFQLAQKQNFEGLGAKDLLPNLGVTYAQDAPPVRRGQWAPPPQPHNFFAIGKRADGLPVEMIEFASDERGQLNYKQQYLFQYDQLANGQNRVTIQNWVPTDRAPVDGPKRTIGEQQNTLLGVTQYYRNGSNTVRAEYWLPDSIVAPLVKPETQRHPDLQVEFLPDTSNVVIRQKSPSGLFGDGMRESGSEARYDLQKVLPKYKFYDLFGPKF